MVDSISHTVAPESERCWLDRDGGIMAQTVEQGEYDECLAFLSSQLDQAEKNKLWNAGAAMSIEESTAFGLVE